MPPGEALSVGGHSPCPNVTLLPASSSKTNYKSSVVSRNSASSGVMRTASWPSSWRIMARAMTGVICSSTYGPPLWMRIVTARRMANETISVARWKTRTARTYRRNEGQPRPAGCGLARPGRRKQASTPRARWSTGPARDMVSG